MERYKRGRKLGVVTGIVTMVLMLAVTLVAPSAKADSINNTDFVITIDTRLGSGTNSFLIPTRAGGGITPNYTVDCNNDGVVDATGQTGNYTCNYPAAGVYKIRIGGTLPSIIFNGSADRLKLTEINQWGTQQWRLLGYAFSGAENMEMKATDTPDLSRATAIELMFNEAKSMTGTQGNWNWNTSTILSMNATFAGATLFNGNITGWDVSKVANFGSMFRNAKAFNQNITGWDTVSATRMDSMFSGATAFDQPIGSWNTSKVTHFNSMFIYTKFNQNIGAWDTSSAINMNSMFNSNSVFNNGGSDSIKDWNTSKVTDFAGMFSTNVSFNQPIGGWNTSSATNMNTMFYGAKNFNQPLNDWDVSRATNMSGMFYAAENFNQPLNNWNTSSATNMSTMFYGAYRFNQNIGGWNMSNVTNASRMLGSLGVLPEMHPDTYDAILTGWASQTLKPGVNLWASNLMYCGATDARALLIKPVADGGKGWTITGDSLGCPPKNIQLSNSTVNENTTAVGNITAETMGGGNKSFVLVGGDGSEDNAKFSLSSNGALSFVTAPDFENPNDAGDTPGNNTYSIRVRTTDATNARLFRERTFVITVADVDDVKPTVTFTAPIKLSNNTITGVQAVIRDNVAIRASGISIDASGTAGASDLVCTQIASNEVRCTVSVTNSGNLALKAVDESGNVLVATETNFIIDKTKPTIDRFDINTDAPNSINQPRVTFATSDNVAIARTELEYVRDNGGVGVSATKTVITNPSSPIVLQLDPNEVQHEVTLRVYDTAGNVSSTTIIFPPIVTIAAPTILSNAAINDSTVTITSPMGNDLDQIQVSGITGATISDCVGAGGDTTEPYANPVRCKINNISQSGTLRVVARDAGTTARGSSEHIYQIDTGKSVVTITAPTKLKNADIADTTIAISDNFGINANAVAIDSSSTVAASDLQCTQVSAVAVNCTVRITASGNLVIRATDLAGNQTTAHEDNYVVDRVAPVVTITTPAAVAQANQNHYTLKGTCTAGDGNVALVIAGQNQTANCDGGNWQIELDLSMVADGSIAISAKQTDAAGNSTTVTVTAAKDTVAPVIAINSPALINSVNMANYQLSGSCETTEGNVTLEWNGQTATAACGSGTWQRTFDFSSLADGNNVIEVKASQTDQYGNKSTATELLSKNSIRPTVTVNQKAGQADPTNADAAEFVVKFSTDVTGLTPDNFTVSGTTGVVAYFAAIDAQNYELTISGMTSGDTATVSLPAGKAEDVNGNPNTASTSTDNSVRYDTDAPVLTIDMPQPITYLNLSNYSLKGTCTAGDGNVTVSVGGLSTTVTCGADSKWQATLDVSSLVDGNVAVNVSQTDAAGNVGNANATTTKDSRVLGQDLNSATTEVSISPTLTQATLSVNEIGTCSNINTAQSKLLSPGGVTHPANVTILGGVHFELGCTVNGGSSKITLQLGEYYADTSILRAYKLIGGQLQPTNVQFSNNSGKTFITFNLTDGLTTSADNLIDDDGATDAKIIDPLYIGIYRQPLATTITGVLSNTGMAVWVMVGAGVVLVVAGCVLVVKKRRKR